MSTTRDKHRPLGQYITDYEGQEYESKIPKDCYHEKPDTDEKRWVCILCGQEVQEVKR